MSNQQGRSVLKLKSRKKAWSAVGLFLCAAVLAGYAGCVSGREPAAESQYGLKRDGSGRLVSEDDELTDVTEEQLYGDLEAGLDSPLWSEEDQSSENVIDRALSQSPYKDFEPVYSDKVSKSAAGGGAAGSKQPPAAKGTGSKDTKKLGEMSRKGQGPRQVKEASKKEKSK